MPAPSTLRLFAGASLCLIAILGGSPAPAAALSGGDDAPFEDARVARVLGDAMVLGSRDERWRYAEQNLPVERRDVYLTGASGELTLEFRGGVLVDMDHGTRLEVVNAARGPHLRLERGALYLVLLNNRTAYERVRVAWEGGSVYLGDRGSYRVDRFADGTVRAMVLRGRARVRAGGGGRHLDPGEAILIGRSGFASRETSYRPGDYDTFDRAVIDRYTGIFGYRPPRHFPHVLVGFWELDTRGTWLYVPAWRSYCWKPRTPGRDWRPFRAGKWRRTPRGAWTWIPAESWGHVTSHYGAWAYLAGKGWVWKPGRTYNPGRVRWTRSGNYLGWAPIGPGGKPVGPASEKSPYLFVRADRLKAGEAAEPVAGRPLPADAPVADDPAALMPELAEAAAEPDDGGAALAAAEAEAAGSEAARERGESAREDAEDAGVVLARPDDGAEASSAPEPVAGEEEGGAIPVSAPAPESPETPLPQAGTEGLEELPTVDPPPAGSVANAPADAPADVPVDTPADAPADAITIAPEGEPAAEAGPADSKKAARETERAERRAANEAKKTDARAAREAARLQKAGRQPDAEPPAAAQGGAPGAAPAEPGASAD